MNADLKPLVEQLKNKLTQANLDELKAQVLQGVHLGRQIFEAKAKDIYKQSKNSKVVHHYVIPLLESEQANKALDLANEKLKLKDTPFMNKVLQIRQELIDLKVQNAREAEPVVEPSTEESTDKPQTPV